MAEVGCKKDIAVNFLEVDKYSLFRGDIEVQGGTVFNKPIHINSTVSHFGHAKGDIYSDPIAVGPAFAGVAGGNASKAVFDKFNASLPANAVISGLFLSVNNGSFNASDHFGANCSGSVKLKLGDDTNDERFLKEGLFLNSSLSNLEAGRSYSIIKDNLVTDDNKLKHDVWVNASNYFKHGDNLNPDGSTSVNVFQLQNGSAVPCAPILTLNCSEAAGRDAIFTHNCSLQVFIRYESPFTHNDMFDD